MSDVLRHTVCVMCVCTVCVLWGKEEGKEGKERGKGKKREGSVVSSFLGGKGDDLPRDLNSQFN